MKTVSEVLRWIADNDPAGDVAAVMAFGTNRLDRAEKGLRLLADALEQPGVIAHLVAAGLPTTAALAANLPADDGARAALAEVERRAREVIRKQARYECETSAETILTIVASVAAALPDSDGARAAIKAEALREAVEFAHEERRRIWAENLDEPITLTQHWSAAAGWLASRIRAYERGDEPNWPDAMNAAALDGEHS